MNTTTTKTSINTTITPANGTGVLGIREYYSRDTTNPTQWWLYSLTGNNTLWDAQQPPDYNMTLNTSTDVAPAVHSLT
jgi:hypothetical protein